MSNNKDNMTPERWAQIKAINLSAPKFIHISCEAKMVRTGLGAKTRWVPSISKGNTYRPTRRRAGRGA